MLNLNEARKKIVEFIRKQVEAAGPAAANGVVIGISGGIDSAVSAALCVEALGPDKVLGLVMPDTRVTPKEDTEDAFKLIKQLKIRHKLIEIDSIHHAYMLYLDQGKLAEGNLRARIRMGLLYYYANLEKRLVSGTEDKSELSLGYFSRWGDQASDFEPIQDIYKTDVRTLGEILDVPEGMIKKESSPQLWKGQLAVAELGISYDKVDKVLRTIGDWKNPIDIYEVGKKARVTPEVVKLVVSMHNYSAFKRDHQPFCHIE